MNKIEFKPKNYSFTFTVPSFKKVFYKGKYHAYGSLPQCHQYALLENVLQDSSNFNCIKWVYEEHADKRLHIHGFINIAFEEQVDLFRDFFYRDYRIKISRKSYLKISDVQETYKDIQFFIDYMNKYQGEIVYFQSIDEHKKLYKSLDGLKHIVKIEYNVDLPPPDLIQESSNLPYENYLFGKLNKFIVEI